jgi:hypothetical protein
VTLAAGSTATAGASTPVQVVPITGTTAGVTLVRGGRAVLLTSALARHARRGTVNLQCRQAFGSTAPTSGETGVGGPVLPRRAVSIPRRQDLCVVSLTTVRSRSVSTRPIAGIALNAAGAESLYELVVGQYMVLASAGSDDGIFPEDLQRGLRRVRVLGRPLAVVPTAAPDTPVATGQLGVFREGGRSSVTATTPGGRHLYLDFDPTARSFSTNVYDAITGDLLVTGGTTYSSPPSPPR